MGIYCCEVPKRNLPLKSISNDLLPKVYPNLVGHRKKRFGHLRIELAS